MISTRLHIAACMLLAASTAAGQAWVRTVEALSGHSYAPTAGATNTRTTVQWLDGLGRESHTARVGAGENGVGDMTTMVAYDSQGRPVRHYLPVALSDAMGSSPGLDFPTTAATYHGDSFPYSETLYTADGTGRVAEQRLPGQDWSDGNAVVGVRHIHTFNYPSWYDGQHSYSLDCLLFTVDAAGGLRVAENEIYNEGTLRVDIAIDEDDRATATFTDNRGRVVLVRRWNKTATGTLQGVADTYWVHDRHGRLRYIVPPMAVAALGSIHGGTVSSAVIDRWCYRYEYDGRDRCVVKKLPGIAERHFVYDRLNRVIMTQDGVQRATGEWTVTKHDARHRVALQGRATLPGATRQSLQALWADSLLLVAHDTSRPMEGDLQYRSVTPGLPITADRAWYYDDYSHWNGLLTLPANTGQGQLTATLTGMETGTAVTDFGGGVTVTATAYDSRGRVTATYERDLYGQRHAITDLLTLDFTGRVTARERVTSLLAEQTVTERHRERWSNTYEAWNGLKWSRHRYGELDWVTLNYLKYDDQGRVKERYFAPAPYGISYSYNIRGWLTASSWGKYRQTIAYGNFSPDITFIQEDRYRADGSRYQYQRHFYYDGLGRLDHTWDYESGRYSEQYGYDLNGNITSLRRGGSGAYDVLTMGYEGNRLTSVTDSGNDNLLGEVPQLAAGGAYAMDYDADGRLTADESRGVTRVVYNPLGLPQRVTMDDGCYVTNAYRADGVKTYESTLRQHYEYIRQWDAAQGDYVVVDSVPRSQTDWRSHYGDLVKAKGRLPRIYNEAGYIDIHNGGDSVSYHYWLTDHLGSVHAVVDANNGVEQAHDYTVSGVPATRLGQTVDHHLHTGKPWLGFNGLGWYDNRARVLDALTGRFTTPDPLAERYPDQSPYAHCANNPVRNIDPTGKILEYPSSPSNMSFNYKMRDVRAYVGTDIKEIEEKLRNSPHHFVVFDANREGGGNRIRTSIFNKDEEGNTIYQVEIYVDLDNANILDDNNTMSPAMAAFHEFVHAEAIADNGELYFKNVRTFDEQYGNLEERRNIEYIENPKAAELGEPIRKNHKFRELEKVDDVRFHKTNGKEYFK